MCNYLSGARWLILAVVIPSLYIKYHRQGYTTLMLRLLAELGIDISAVYLPSNQPIGRR